MKSKWRSKKKDAAVIIDRLKAQLGAVLDVEDSKEDLKKEFVTKYAELLRQSEARHATEVEQLKRIIEEREATIEQLTGRLRVILAGPCQVGIDHVALDPAHRIGVNGDEVNCTHEDQYRNCLSLCRFCQSRV